MKIATVQFDADFSDVKSNLSKAKSFIEQAASNGAELVLLPEFFTSAIGFSDKMLDAAIENHQAEAALIKWSNKYQIIIGGSYIAFDGNNAYNLFQLIFPNGEIFEHKKDIPTQFENCYYTNGDENNILHTPVGSIGVALCWEMIRYDTLKRLSGNADIVLSGSCWWDLPEDSGIQREPLRKYNRQLALETPVTFAKLLGVPLIHANHCGKITALNFPNADKLQTRQFVGAAQIVDSFGNITARRCFYEGEGTVLSDISWDINERKQTDFDTEKYWIPQLPDSYISAWETINPKGREYYKSTALPYYKSRIQKQ